MTTDKIELSIDRYLEQLMTVKDRHEQKNSMQKTLQYIASLPLTEQQEWLTGLQTSIRKDLDEIAVQLKN
ncbi:hypothetical protein [Microscilla marina]|uniref:Uncharacterized protein n=1 Tax=Microscilla marina ATCC 23134 TaxID=313606 RepID=A1ZZI7_MICM2|nr:hypothetical protein [Microscilla marina]EAY24182.1 hypothetical protein M23134_01770 [Microscilla marina ATCC 23134]